jgi:hypothetical protein
MSPRCSPTAPLALLLVLVTGCSGNSGDPIVATGVIGPGGGSITVSDGDLAGTELVIPAGAVDQDYEVNIASGQISKVEGALPVGPPVLVQPAKLELILPGTLTIPFDPASIPTGTPDSELRAGYRDGAGRVSFVELLSIDPVNGLARIEIEALGSWWIAVPDVLVTADYLPLNDGDTYRFDNDVILTIARTTNEPNLQGRAVVKLTFTTRTGADGYYWDDSSGLELLGRFFVPDTQEVLDSSARLLAERELIGTTRASTYTFLGFVPFGSTFVDYSGIAITDTRPEQRTQVDVPAGRFNDCVIVSFDTLFRLTPPGEGSESLRMWLARDVGPVQVQFDGNPVLRLRSAAVGNRVIGVD